MDQSPDLLPDSGPYAGADLANARRFAALGWAICAALTLAFIPFFPPTETVGDAGWALAIAAVLLLGGASVWAFRRGGFGTLLMTSFSGIALIGVLEYTAGAEAPYLHMLLFVVVATALVQPPAAIAGTLAAVAAVRLSPLLYDASDFRTADALMQSLLWIGLAAFVRGLIAEIRRQRLELRRRGEEAGRSAREDALTGLGNRRAFDEDMRRELARAGRTREPMSLVLLDVDDFKAINDGFGHTQGDEALRAVARALDKATRVIDGCYRWGGDEFAVVLPGADAARAADVAARIAGALSGEAGFRGGEPLLVTAGIAQLEPEMSVDELLAVADSRLIAAKQDRTPSPEPLPRNAR